VWKWKPDVEFQYGGRFGEFNGMSSQSHVSHCTVLPLGEFTVTIPEPHAHCRVQSPDEINVVILPHCRALKFHLALKIGFRDVLFFVLFLMQFRL